MTPTKMNSVGYRNFTAGGLQVFMSITVLSFLLCLLFVLPKAPTITRPIVFFLFLPIIAVVFKFILSTLRWMTEYIICFILGKLHLGTVVSYNGKILTVSIEDCYYEFPVEREHRKHLAGTKLKIRSYKKFIYIVEEVKKDNA